MNNWLTILLLLFSIAGGAFGVGVDIDYTVDRRNWVDIHDPLEKHGEHSISNYDENSCRVYCEKDLEHYTEENARLRENIASIKVSRENSVDVLLKHILREFVAKLNIDLADEEHDIYKMAQVTLSAENVRLIRKYLASTKISEEFGLREDIRFALEHFIVETDHRSKSSLFSLLHFLLPYVTMLNIVVLPLAMMVVVRSIFSVRQLLIVVLVAAFFVSCYFTYARKYQEVLAQRFERVEKKSHNECTPQGLLSEAYNVMLSYVRIKGKSECLQSYEDVLIEPFLLVDPLQVVAEVLSNFFLSPLSVAGIHFNKFFNDFFTNTPIHLAIVKGMFLVFLLFYLTGYRLRTFLATIEPAESIARMLPNSLLAEQNFSQKRVFNQRQIEHKAKTKTSFRAIQSIPSQPNDDFEHSSYLFTELDDSNVTKRKAASPRRSASMGR